MINLEIKNCNMTSTEKLQKYQLYHLEKLLNTFLTGEEILPSDQSRIVEQAKFVYSSLGKTFKKQNIQRIQNKEKFLKNLLIIEWKKCKIYVNKLILII